MKKSSVRFAAAWRTGSWLLAAAFTSSAAWAMPVDDLVGEQMSVRELMRLETEEALRLARARAPRPSPVPRSGTRLHRGHDLSGAATHAPELVAIYGVGRHLMAEVSYGPRRLLYRRGQALPVGAGSEAGVFLLRHIAENCVQLQHGDDKRELCIGAVAQSHDSGPGGVAPVTQGASVARTSASSDAGVQP